MTWRQEAISAAVFALAVGQKNKRTPQGRVRRACSLRPLNRDVVVQGNPRVYKALRNELAAVLEELQRIESGSGIDDELLETIELIAVILGGLKGEEQNE